MAKADDNSAMIGEELKALRKQLGLSLAQASRQVEVSARTWARWEAGDQNIPKCAMKLFRILNGLEDIPPVPPRGVRVVVSTERTNLSTVGYVRDPDNNGHKP